MRLAQGFVYAISTLCLAAVCRAEEGRGRLAFVGKNAVALDEYPIGITRVLTTCACLCVDGFPRSLKPGETGEVAVAITKYGVAGAFEKVCYIQSDDPRTPLAALRLSGVARPLFTVACDAKTLLGPVTPGLVWTGRYTVAASETGLSLGAPVLRSRGTRCDYAIRTKIGPRTVYEVTKTVTFEGQGALESALVFPVLGKADVADAPDRLSLPDSGFPLTRRLLVAVDAPAPSAQDRPQCSSDVAGVEVGVKAATGGKTFLVELTFPADYPVRLQSAGQDMIRIIHSRDSVAVPSQ